MCTPYEKEYLRRDGSRVSVFLSDAMLPGDDEAIAASISLLLSNPRKAEQMGEQGRLRCHEFGLPAMIARLDELYRNMGAMRVAVPAKPILKSQHWLNPQQDAK